MKLCLTTTVAVRLCQVTLRCCLGEQKSGFPLSTGPACPSHTVYALWGQAFEDPTPVEILPRPWADSALPSAPAQLTCEKQQLLVPLTWVAHARAQAGGARGPQPTLLSVTSFATISLPVLSKASPSASLLRWAAGLEMRKAILRKGFWSSSLGMCLPKNKVSG